MNANERLKAWIGTAAVLIGTLLPVLIVVPFGWLWLWQHGYIRYWLAAALALSFAIFLIRTWLLGRLKRELARGAAAAAADIPPHAEREAAARAAVDRLAADVDPARLTGRDELTAIALETIEAVAREMHPGTDNPVWSFTVPEALTLMERIAQRLRPIVIESIPLGDRLTVGQAIRLYQWRKVIDVASSAYDIWRVIRLLNPISAATQEIRERLSKTMYEGLRQELAKRLLSTYVREVGLAAIDLYSGRLAVLSPENPLADRADLPEEAAPLRILLAGKSGSGKSSLVNALAREVQAPTDALPQTRSFTTYEVQGPGVPPVELIDSPGLATAADSDTIAAKATDCDVLVWVASADRPDRLIDRAALDTFRSHFAANRNRAAPPVLVVLTNIDRLRPFADWSPPYDIAAPTTPKARSIADSIAAAAEDLGIPASRIVPVSLAPDRAAYNVDLVWAELANLLPAAKSAQLLRRLAKTRKSIDWGRLLTQAVGAGRLATDLLTRR